MRGKLLTAILAFHTTALFAGDFLGAQSCSTSGCHGGGQRNEFIIWSKKDFHSRSYATLTTARSARLAETLNIADATTSARCTTCHAPLPAPHRAEGVSCETCHGAADGWLRTHTRPDYTHGERIQAGMRALRDLPSRANVCVACHQNVDADILRAGHPELIFELDGQTTALPRHWQELPGYSRAAAWRTGQEAALREMKWQLSRTPDDALQARVEALEWVLAKGGTNATPADFRDPSVSREQQARRAERLVLAWDRLTDSPKLDELFRLSQSRPDFDPQKFADALAQLLSDSPPPGEAR